MLNGCFPTQTGLDSENVERCLSDRITISTRDIRQADATARADLTRVLKLPKDLIEKFSNVSHKVDAIQSYLHHDAAIGDDELAL
jgi:hypothetical protein